MAEFGTNVNQEGEDKASEYVQDHILRLMGYNPQRGPRGVDFYVEKDGKRIGIDGQTEARPDSTQGRGIHQGDLKPIVPEGYGYAPNRRNPNGQNTKANQDAIRQDVQTHLRGAMNAGNTFDQA